MNSRADGGLNGTAVAVSRVSENPSLAEYDAVIIGSPVYRNDQILESITDFVTQNNAAMAEKNVGIFVVALDPGEVIHLNGDDTSTELSHRAVYTGGRIYQQGLLIGNASCRAHVDCAVRRVLRAEEEGFIQSIPGLRALHPEASMCHETRIGRIAPEQVSYLQSRGWRSTGQSR